MDFLKATKRIIYTQHNTQSLFSLRSIQLVFTKAFHLLNLYTWIMHQVSRCNPQLTHPKLPYQISGPHHFNFCFKRIYGNLACALLSIIASIFTKKYCMLNVYCPYGYTRYEKEIWIKNILYAWMWQSLYKSISKWKNTTTTKTWI